ncbi:MAG: hypothetical protein J5967_00955 [Oscillospiraceae bacterium]|nr:hypothetical protein [Oscillospiraceae bacterium]
MIIRVPYGTGTISAKIPDSLRVHVVDPKTEAVTPRRLPGSEYGFLARRTGGWQEAEALILRAVWQLCEEKK